MRKFQARALVALAFAAALAACHHSDDDRNDTTTPPPVAETPPPVSTVDAFFSYVMQLVSTQDETSEPVRSRGWSATAPENTEPQPLPAS